MTKVVGFRISILALALAPFAGMGAQQSFVVEQGSRVVLLGKSNVNSWRCSASQFATDLRVDSVVPHAVHLTVVVPVKAMDCGRQRMNDDMYRALKADSFPEIRYELTSYKIHSPTTHPDSIHVHSIGELTVAGKTQRVEILVAAQRTSTGDVIGQGGARMLMTDFGIRPPTAFFGAIRAKNALEVRVEAQVKGLASAAIAAGIARAGRN